MLVAQVISLARRTDRREEFAAHAREQGMPFRFIDAISEPPVHTAITRSHKKVVRHAMEQGWPQVLVMEDDCWFPSADGFRWFLSMAPRTPFDLFLGGVYGCQPEGAAIVTGFCATHCYIVQAAFYARFLAAPENMHIDHALKTLGGNYHVCRPFAAIQRNGYSDNAKGHVDYMHYVQGKYRE